MRMADAFTEVAFAGNPAAVVFVDEAPSDKWMEAVARETNVPDTAFVIREDLPDADSIFGSQIERFSRLDLKVLIPVIDVANCVRAVLRRRVLVSHDLPPQCSFPDLVLVCLTVGDEELLAT